MERQEDEPAEDYQHRTTIAVKAFRGLFWMATTGFGSRIVSLLSTLLITHYLLPEDYGEVQNTYIVVWMIDLIAAVGIPQYIADRAGVTQRKIYGATLYFHFFGLITLLPCLLLARPLGPHLGAPHMYLYMPGFVFITLISRVATLPDRILVRELRFRAASVIRGAAEIAYGVVSLGLAVAGTRLDFKIAGVAFVFGGGYAIVWGGLARVLVRLIGGLGATKVRDWFALVRPDKRDTREMFAFGVPVTIASLGSLGARRFDNFMMGSLYGPAAVGIYNFAYNLADVPPSIVGEALGDVLAPSLTKLAPADRPRELIRWIGFSALACFPLGIGLSAVARSLSWMFNDHWSSAMPMIVLLGSLSLTRPVLGTVFSYLQVEGKTRALMFLEWSKALGVPAAIYAGGHLVRAYFPAFDEQYGPLLGCALVGVIFVLNMLSYQFIAAKVSNLPVRLFLTPLIRPLLSCVPMVAAVLTVRFIIGSHITSRPMLVLRLVCEILAGAFVFAISAWLIARKLLREIVDLLRAMLKKRRGV